MESIDNIESLRLHLQGALKLEHATVPAYLTALFSIKDGCNTEAAEVIRSVVMEEMLHMILVGNVLNAVDGNPVIDHKDFVPEYPGYLPYSDQSFEVGLLPFSPEALQIFLRIEKPEPAGARPEPEEFETIGQFYDALQQALKQLEGEAIKNGKTIFTGDRARQIAPENYYYGGGGRVIEVTCLESALAALEQVVVQGEGRDHSIYDGDNHGFGQAAEPAHYFRFNELHVGRYYAAGDNPGDSPTGPELPVDWSGVWNMAPNPKMARYADQTDLHNMMVRFNTEYRDLLKQLDAAFNGEPDRLLESVPTMYRLKYHAVALMKVPANNGDTTVGPSWEYIAD